MDPRYLAIATQQFSEWSAHERERRQRHEAGQRKAPRRRFWLFRSRQATQTLPATCCEPTATQAC